MVCCGGMERGRQSDGTSSGPLHKFSHNPVRLFINMLFPWKHTVVIALLKTATTSSACLIVTVYYALPGCAVLHIKVSTTKWDAFWQIVRWAQLHRVHRGFGYCHLWFKASSLVWCLKIRLFYISPPLLLLSAWQDETANTFPIRTLTVQQRGRDGSWASSKLCSPSCPQWASPDCKWISYWFGII